MPYSEIPRISLSEQQEEEKSREEEMCGLLCFVGMMSHWSEKKRIHVLLWRTEVGTSLETEGMREFALLSISTGCLEVNTTGFSPELGYGVNPARL